MPKPQVYCADCCPGWRVRCNGYTMEGWVLADPANHMVYCFALDTEAKILVTDDGMPVIECYRGLVEVHQPLVEGEF